MLFVNDAPPGPDADFKVLYHRMAVEGMVQSSVMRGVRYDKSDDYCDEWRCPAVTWSAGGEEIYQFGPGKTITIKPAGVLMLAPGVRYAYEARGDAAFVSNMIVFPKWITEAATHTVFDEPTRQTREFSTRLFRPFANVASAMTEIAGRCRSGDMDVDWYNEHMTLLYAGLLDECAKASAAAQRVDAEKPATRAELARRVGRAQDFILESYADPGLELGVIAKAACLSPFHLIRVFKMIAGVTPMQCLAGVRMEAALRLLRETKLTVAQTAESVGYKNRVAFSKAFRRHHGLPPSHAARPDRACDECNLPPAAP